MHTQTQNTKMSTTKTNNNYTFKMQGRPHCKNKEQGSAL